LSGGDGDFAPAVATLGADPGRWLVALDFDGTLAPIVADPETARLEPALSPLLARLSASVGAVAVISGRPRSFLERQLPGVLTLGSYGLELPPGWGNDDSPEAPDTVATAAGLGAARADLEPVLPPGARLEVKPFGLVMHYRGAGSAFDVAAATRLMEAVAERHHLQLLPGRMVLELKPGVAVDKGWALEHLASRVSASAVVFVGDDLGDIPAWEAARRLGQRIPALAVGIASPELPSAALQTCHLVLPDRSRLGELLRTLAARAEGLPGT